VAGASGHRCLIPKARDYGTASLTIHHSHHIACLAAYLLRATQEGFMMILASSDPAVQSVAPFGGTQAVFTPNPIAAGIPTSGTPFLVDISASITTNGMSNRLHKAGKQFEEEWLIDGQGHPSRDPAVLATDPPGTILPLGGLVGRAQGLRAGGADRGADRRPVRFRPRRSAGGMGRDGVHVALRSFGLRW
jgi:L-lactate dehydrogenase